MGVVVWLFRGGYGLGLIVGFGSAVVVCWLCILFVVCLVVLRWLAI